MFDLVLGILATVCIGGIALAILIGRP